MQKSTSKDARANRGKLTKYKNCFYLYQMTNQFLHLIVIVLTLHFNVKGQSINGQFNADSVYVYKNFTAHGTTAGLRYNHFILDSINATKTKLSDSDLTELVNIFKPISNKKLFQTKYGGDICYLLVYNQGIKSNFVLYSSLDDGMLHDLSSMKKWTLNNNDDKRRLYELINKNWP